MLYIYIFITYKTYTPKNERIFEWVTVLEFFFLFFGFVFFCFFVF